MDYLITNSEVSNAISQLKNRKAHGPDLIKNEMIKCGKTYLLKSLTKLFNLVLSAGHYPLIWSKGRIVSIAYIRKETQITQRIIRGYNNLERSG